MSNRLESGIGVVVRPGLRLRPWGDGFEVYTSIDLPMPEPIFTIERNVALRTDSRHTDFVSRFATDLSPGGILAGDSESARIAQLCALFLCVGAWTQRVGRCCLTCSPAALFRYEFHGTNGTSFWEPYFRMLPRKFPELPHFPGPVYGHYVRTVAGWCSRTVRCSCRTQRLVNRGSLLLVSERKGTLQVRQHLERVVEWLVAREEVFAYPSKETVHDWVAWFVVTRLELLGMVR